MSPGLERCFVRAEKQPAQKRIMELNADHALVDTMQALFDANAEDTTLVYAHFSTDRH